MRPRRAEHSNAVSSGGDRRADGGRAAGALPSLSVLASSSSRPFQIYWLDFWPNAFTLLPPRRNGWVPSEGLLRVTWLARAVNTDERLRDRFRPFHLPHLETGKKGYYVFPLTWATASVDNWCLMRPLRFGWGFEDGLRPAAAAAAAAVLSTFTDCISLLLAAER